MTEKKPILGITMGDAAGIGPEIAAKALSKREIYYICRPLVVGDADVMRQAVNITGVELKVSSISEVTEARFEYGIMDVIDLNNVDLNKLEHGVVSAMTGNAAFESIIKVIDLALDKQIDGTVTGPIHKESLNAAGHHFAGHTEIYAHYTNTEDYAMFLVHGDLRVIHVSTHVPLREACELVKKERILSVIRLANNACKSLGIDSPRVGVAGLNPHSSDGGLFGYEEQGEIIPAIEEAKSIGILAEGPVPPDTLFSKAKGGLYDVCVAMYHDQGHIPIKLVGFVWNDEKQKWSSISGVNITLGLPIIRTSVDHGTAFGKAGKGTAIPDSLINAIEHAAKFATAKA